MTESDCCIQVFKGGIFHVFDPRPDEIDIEDIAHALALVCRWNGHCRSHLSVAQHCVLVSRLCPAAHRLWGLLHDGAEAYLGDLPDPIKRVVPAFREAEDRILRVIAEKFGLCWPMPPEVRQADKEILLAEKRDWVTPCRVPWTASGFTAAEERITPWTPERAERVFLTEFRLLTTRNARADLVEGRGGE